MASFIMIFFHSSFSIVKLKGFLWQSQELWWKSRQTWCGAKLYHKPSSIGKNLFFFSFSFSFLNYFLESPLWIQSFSVVFLLFWNSTIEETSKMDSKYAVGLRAVLLKVQQFQKGEKIEDIVAKMLVFLFSDWLSVEKYSNLLHFFLKIKRPFF